jgi:hypothetical protein
MANRLLDRQASLLEYLTSGGAIFGQQGDVPAARELQGIDPALLRIEARFSYEKRMEKIVAIFPRTFGMLGDTEHAIARAFVDACPPTSIRRIDNARQFYAFVSARWQRERPSPPYLFDVAACELACAEARIRADAPPASTGQPEGSTRPGSIRRGSGVVLLRCRFDVRPIFEQVSPDAAPVERDTPLAVTIPPGAEGPSVIELAPVIFDLLASLDDWADAEPFTATPELMELIADLAGHAMIEVNR